MRLALCPRARDIYRVGLISFVLKTMFIKPRCKETNDPSGRQQSKCNRSCHVSPIVFLSMLWVFALPIGKRTTISYERTNQIDCNYYNFYFMLPHIPTNSFVANCALSRAICSDSKCRAVHSEPRSSINSF